MIIYCLFFRFRAKDSVNTTRVIAGTISSNINLFGNKNARRALLEELQTSETWRKIAECYIHAKYSRKKIRSDFAVLVVNLFDVGKR